MQEQALLRLGTDTLYARKSGLYLGFRPQLPMEGNTETVRLVSNLL